MSSIEIMLVQLKERLIKEFKEREGLDVTVTLHAAQTPYGVEYNVVTSGLNFTEVHSVHKNQGGAWDYVRNIKL